MEYRAFGRTGWKVSEIGFGAWQLGGTWGAVDDGESVRALLHAFEKGINFVDTAALYGKGRSESVVGKAIREWKSDRIFVATKIGPASYDPALGEDRQSMKGQYRLDYLEPQLDAALARLGVDCVDLLQLHLWLPDGMNHPDWLEALRALQRMGKIAHFGVSLADIRPHDGVALAASGAVTSIQTIFNIFEQEPLQALFPAGVATDTAFIARVPFDSGALTGSWNQTTYSQWAQDDKRRSMYRNGRFAETLRRSAAIKDRTSAHYPTLAEAALRFSLSSAAVSTVVCGMRNQTEVDMNIAYSDGQAFPGDLAEALKAHDWKHKFYS